MTKSELIAAVQAKKGYVATLSDTKTPDSPTGNKEKRMLVAETLNSDGTKGMYNVFYVHNTETDEAWFYNVEPEALDTKEPSAPQVVINALNDYCKANFSAYFLIPDRIDPTNKWAVVEAYILNAGNLEKKNVMVYKKGTNPITHIDIV